MKIDIKNAASAAALLCAAIWGLSYVVLVAAMDSGLTPGQVIPIRFLVSAAAMAIIFRKKLGCVSPGALKAGAASGALLFAGLVFGMEGLRLTTASKSAFLTSTTVVIVPFLKWAAHRVKPDAGCFAGMALAVAGIGLLTLDGRLGDVNPGDVLALTGAAFLSAQMIAVEKYVKDYGVVELTAAQFAAAGLLGLGYAFARGAPVSTTPRGVAAMAFISLVSTLAAMLLQNWAQRAVPPARVAVIFSSEAVFAALFAAWLLKEVMTPRMILGAGLIFAATLTAAAPRLSFFSIKAPRGP